MEIKQNAPAIAGNLFGKVLSERSVSRRLSEKQNRAR
jgi:hypothetical protein